MRKLLATFCTYLTLLAVAPAPMAFATVTTTATFDVRTTGSNSNAGCFDTTVSVPGTDESQANSGTAISVTLVTGTTGTGSPAFTSTTHGPGNCIVITGGSGCTVGTYVISSQAAGTATFNSTMGSSTDVCTGTIGGGFLTIAQAYSKAVTGNIVYIQSGTYTITSVLTTAACLAVRGGTS